MHPSLTKGPRALKSGFGSIHKVFNIDAGQAKSNHGTSTLSLLPSDWTRNHSEIANLAGANRQVAGRAVRLAATTVIVTVMAVTVAAAMVIVIVAVSTAMMMMLAMAAVSTMFVVRAARATLLYLLLGLLLLDGKALGSKDATDQEAEREQKLCFMHRDDSNPNRPRPLLYSKSLSVHITQSVYIIL